MARTAEGTRGSNKLLYAAMVVLAVAAMFKLGHASAASGPPQPAAPVLGKLLPITRPTAHTLTLPYSVPTHIDMPAVNVHADVITVGVNPDDTIGTPSLSDAKVAAWYNGSPTPGQMGSSIIDAHVDSSKMSDYRGAFFYLGLAKPGMEIDVTRSDHSVAVFTVDEVQDALKSAFPTDQVYAATPYPGLRLITCGGDFDQKTHEYLGNTIVYAHMTAQHTPTAPRNFR
ncbi:class F sortase [Actinospica durhamensis]|uniref:Class F sortase n=1 Tax=Actinospica durhamensis TaxID=1508375 RepID=A0A941F157_9ACTN|nr:class F sortase [Actinospica durhamensis]MBR7838819.1 class F sortase [Actinospica durhamensis]